MATVTKTIGGDGDEARGYVTWQIDYDDATLRLLAVRCINHSTEAAWGKVVSVAKPSRTASITVAAGSTQTISVPPGASNRFDVTITPNGRVDGVDYAFMWPAP